jgi:hypothetical protein
LPAQVKPPVTDTSVKRLLDGRVREYFLDARDDGECVWVFHHLPKTAGSSFGLELTRAVRPAVNVAQNLRRPDGGFADMQEALRHHMKRISRGDYRCVRGHFNGAQIEQLRTRLDDARVITILRDPIERVLSEYRYVHTPANPRHERQSKRFPTLESYVDWEHSGDGMFKRLRRTPEQSVEELVNELESRYAFIGLLESFSVSRRVLFRLLGTEPPREQTVVNRSSGGGGEPAEVRKLLPQLVETNKRDLFLYEHVRRRFAAVEPEIVAFLDRNGAR